MSINAAPIISTTPLSYSNKPYQEPALHEIPDGTSETTEGLRNRLRAANRRILFPAGQD